MAEDAKVAGTGETGVTGFTDEEIEEQVERDIELFRDALEKLSRE